MLRAAQQRNPSQAQEELEMRLVDMEGLCRGHVEGINLLRRWDVSPAAEAISQLCQG